MSSAIPAASLAAAPHNRKRKAEQDIVQPQDAAAVDELAADPAGTSTPAKRGPGRPRKNPAAPTPTAAPLAEGESPPKRKRGRPPRPRTAEELAAMAAKAAMPKRPRGRPRKPRPEDQQTQHLNPPNATAATAPGTAAAAHISSIPHTAVAGPSGL